LAEAVARFLDRYRDQKHTATTYAETLTHLRTVAGDASAVGALTPEVFAAAMTRWDGSAPATWNRHLAALRSFAGYALRQEWLTVDPARLLERRKDTARGDKAIPAARLEGLLTDERNALRERVLWRMLYETAARAEEVLTLDVADLDLQFRRARTVSKGGDAEYLHWGHRDRAAAAPAAEGPQQRPGIPGRSPLTGCWVPRPGTVRHRPGQRPRPVVVCAGRVPVQAGLQTS
jgi:site-specific recombinase XerD